MSLNSKRSSSNGVVMGKSARACDSCVKKRARWYCAADDAFLCQKCDAAVHSANSLARRHHRLRLPSSFSGDTSGDPFPTWHRRARSAKPHAAAQQKPSSPVVPEISPPRDNSDEYDGDDDQLLYRVPIFGGGEFVGCESPKAAVVAGYSPNSNSTEVSLGAAAGFLPTEMELAEFAADVESLLGRGMEDGCDFGIGGLGFIDCEEKEMSSNDGVVKIEFDDDEEVRDIDAFDVNMKMSWSEASVEPFELNLEDYEESCEALFTEEEAMEPKPEPGDEEVKKSHKSSKKKKKKKILLSLDYEAVITAWASQGSPWTTGARPDFDPDSSWPDSMDTYPAQFHYPNHHFIDVSGVGGTSTILADGGREARVTRYREKRRTRLFSKKIRYEVRKLNAEKRPRMKGRFVKRASFAGPSFPMLK